MPNPRRSTIKKTPEENAILRREIKRMRMGDNPMTRSEACRRIKRNHGIYISHTKARSIETELKTAMPDMISQCHQHTEAPKQPKLHVFGLLNPMPNPSHTEVTL